MVNRGLGDAALSGALSLGLVAAYLFPPALPWLLGVSVIFGWWSLGTQGIISVRNVPLFWPLLVLAGSLFLSGSRAPRSEWFSYFQAGVAVLLYFLFLSVFARFPSSRKRLLGLAVILSCVLGLVALFQFVGLVSPGWAFGYGLQPIRGSGDQLFHAAGLQPRALAFGCQLLFLFHILLGFFVVGEKANRKLALVGLFFCSLAILLTFSKGTWWGWWISLLGVGLVVSRRAFLRVSFALGLGLALLAAVSPVFRARIAGMGAGSSHHRIERWQTSWDALRGATLLGSPSESAGEKSLSLYREVLAASGWAGWAALMAFLGGALGVLVRAYRRAVRLKNKGDQAMALAGLGVWTAFCVTGTFVQQASVVSRVVIFLFVFAWSISPLRAEQLARPRKLSWWGKPMNSVFVSERGGLG